MGLYRLANKIPRSHLAFTYDLIAAGLSFHASLTLRYGTFIPDALEYIHYPIPLIIAVIVQGTSFRLMGMYKGIWRFSSVPDLIRVIKGITLGVLLNALALFIFNRLEYIPRTSFFIDWFILLATIGGGRLFYRFLKDALQEYRRDVKKTNVLIVGAGRAGAQILREIKTNPELGLKVVGFVDDDPKKKGRDIQGTPILGTTDQIKNLAYEHRAMLVYLAIPSATSSQIRTIISQNSDPQLEFKTLPKMEDIFNGKIEFSQLRNVIPEDLLGRQMVQLDTQSLGAMIQGKTILVTGAGGSIGSELCHQILNFKPGRLIVFDQTELFLFNLKNAILKRKAQVDLIPIIGNVRDENKLDLVFRNYSPSIVFHAAAYKHVHMMELNPMEAIKTNVIGTRNVALKAIAHQAEKFVLISTDKAVNPTSIMGTSKRVAERVLLQLQNDLKTSTEFVVVRFGNVLGSSGSVIPVFRKQIEDGGPVTVTHPEVRRFFMAISEAAQLVLQAGAIGHKGQIFVLDMGEPVRILDLAKEMIALSGLSVGEDIQIEFIGLRPGEKLYEEVLTDKEKTLETSHPKLRLAQSSPNLEDFQNDLSFLLSLPEEANRELVQAALKKLVPELILETQGQEASAPNLQ